MKADVELDLVHDGERWIGRNGALTASGATFWELDDDLRRALRDAGEYPEGSRVTVFMGFDYDTIPTWLRQYAAHYFNRYVAIDL